MFTHDVRMRVRRELSKYTISHIRIEGELLLGTRFKERRYDSITLMPETLLVLLVEELWPFWFCLWR